MGFSTNLQGKIAHEALLSRQEAELRLLDAMKRCINVKVKCDRDYATALSSVAAQGLKIDRGDELVGSVVCSSWKSMMEEMENTAKLIRQNADSVESKALDSLNALYAEKRKVRKAYQEEHTRILQQFTHQKRSAGEVQKILVKVAKKTTKGFVADHTNPTNIEFIKYRAATTKHFSEEMGKIEFNLF